MSVGLIIRYGIDQMRSGFVDCGYILSCIYSEKVGWRVDVLR